MKSCFIIWLNNTKGGEKMGGMGFMGLVVAGGGIIGGAIGLLPTLATGDWSYAGSLAIGGAIVGFAVAPFMLFALGDELNL